MDDQVFVVDRQQYLHNSLYHRPSKLVGDMRPAADVYLIWKPLSPTAEDLSKIGILFKPGAPLYDANSALVLKAGSGCVQAKSGEFVFWGVHGRVDIETGEMDYSNMPSPVTPVFTDEMPGLYTIREKDVVLVTSPAKDGEGLSDMAEVMKVLGIEPLKAVEEEGEE